jgi:hypothetical protein
VSFYDESDPAEAELARRWDANREPFETFEEFADRAANLEEQPS